MYAVVHICLTLINSYILTTSRDMTARIYALKAPEGFVPVTLASHRSAVLGAWFTDDMKTVCRHCTLD